MGVGGGGGNAVNRMVQTGIQGVEFWAVNTDVQAISRNLAPGKLAIGQVGFVSASNEFSPSLTRQNCHPIHHRVGKIDLFYYSTCRTLPLI